MISVSTKFRAIGGASALALAAGLTGAAFAQSAPAPVQAAPTPTAPTPPMNVEECAIVNLVVTCAPGTDPDGFQFPGNGLGLDVQAGAVVQGSIDLLANTTGTVDGDIVTAGFGETALVVGTSSNVTINGGVQTSGDFASGIVTGNDATITNNGVIFTSGFVSDGVALDFNSTFINNSLVQTAGGSSFAVFAFGDGVTITNSVTGSIITSGDFASGIVASNDAAIQNDGLIQTFGDNAFGIDVFDNSTVINNGTIFATGDGSIGVAMGDDAVFTNGATGNVSTFGDNVASVLVGDNGTITSNGIIITRGDDAIGIVTGTDAVITLGSTSQLTTTGSNAGGIVVVGDGTVTNAGLIQTIGAGAQAITVTGAATVVNSGTITAALARAIDVADASVVTNTAAGVISSAGDDGIRFNASGSTLTNAGVVESKGGGGNAVEAGGLNDITIANTGIIRANGGAFAAILAGNNLDVTNSGTISSTVVGIVAGTGMTLTNELGGEILGQLAPAIAAGDGATITNAGTISSLQGSGIESAGVGDALTITNSGTIENVSGGAGILLENGTITNLAGGTISGGNGAIVDPSAGSLTVVNLGTLTGGAGVAVDLGAGDDGFVQVNGGTANGTIDGGAGTDVFAAIITDAANRTFDLGVLGTSILGFEDVRIGSQTFDFTGTTAMPAAAAGVFTLTGTGSQAFTVVNTAILDGTSNAAVTLIAGADQGIARAFNITSNGAINTATGDALIVNAEGFTVTNNGAISTAANAALGIRAVANTTIINNGSVTAAGQSTAAIFTGMGSSVTNNGSVTTTADRGVGIVAAGGSTVTNGAAGTISTTGVDAGAVILTGDAALVNNGSITTSGAGAQAVTVTGAATITNAGTISAGAARAIDVAGASAITNAVGGSIISGTTDAIRLNAGGSTVTNRGAISGATGVLGGAGTDTVVNFGSITGTAAAVSLGDGADEFQQWTGASVTGNVNLGGGNDTFVLQGANSTIAGMVIGGMGNDTAVLGGRLDADNLTGFETNTLGALFDLTIVGNRTLTGNVVQVGNVFVNLGVDSLTTSGSITLANTAVLTIATPLDAALVGQTVLVLQDGTGFTNNGATINILDDDLLLSYTPVVGSLSVQVNAVNPLAGSQDPNLDRFGASIASSIGAGTLSAGNFAALNAVTDAAAFQTAANDALSSLSDGVGREIFETSNAASQALDRHLAGEGSAIWGQIQIRGAEQDALSLSADGYESDQLIFTVGADFVALDNIRVGVIASYADIEIEDMAGNVSTERNNVESIKLGAYVALSLGDRGFLNSEIAYLTGEVESERSGFFGAITSGYDFDGFAAKTTVGYDLLPDENIALTPTVGFNAARINFDDTVEAGGFGFAIQRGDAVYTELRAGLELASQLSDKVSGFVSGTAIHDITDSTRSFRLSSSQLGTFGVVLPLREQNRFELAAGASIDVSDAFAIDLGYLGDFNEGYTAHSARANVRIAF
jgi:hypothetical protein